MIELYPAKPEDAAVCARIQTESWRAAFRGIISDEELARAADEARVTKMYERVLANPAMHGAILSINGAPHAIAFWSQSRDEDTPAAAELVCIHSLPGNWRKGFGTLLMEYAVIEMRQAGYKTVMLWVFAENARARAFYEKFGYTLTRRARTELGAQAVQYEMKLN